MARGITKGEDLDEANFMVLKTLYEDVIHSYKVIFEHTETEFHRCFSAHLVYVYGADRDLIDYI